MSADELIGCRRRTGPWRHGQSEALADAHEENVRRYGPNGDKVARHVERCRRLTLEEIEELGHLFGAIPGTATTSGLNELVKELAASAGLTEALTNAIVDTENAVAYAAEQRAQDEHRDDEDSDAAQEAIEQALADSSPGGSVAADMAQALVLAHPLARELTGSGLRDWQRALTRERRFAFGGESGSQP